MFTGLVDAVGTITRVTDSAAGRELHIACDYSQLVDGESISVNGACLTVRDHSQMPDGRSGFSCAAVVTTLDRTTIGAWQQGQRVNLERALKLGDRLGGHMVLGHVDSVAHVRAISWRDDALLIDVTLPSELMPLMVAHGSVTIDGVSLTLNALLDNNAIQLSIIEFTRRHTTLGDLKVADRVHVEADVLAKHVQQLLAPELARLQIMQSSHFTSAAAVS